MASNDDERFWVYVKEQLRVRVRCPTIRYARVVPHEYRFVGMLPDELTEAEIVSALRSADKRVADYDRECEEAKRKKTIEERLTAIEAKLGMEG